MHAEIEPSRLETILKPAYKLVDEVRITYQKDALEIDVADPANVAGGTITVDAGAFETYESLPDEPVEIGVDLAKVWTYNKLLQKKKRLADGDEDETVSLGIDLDDRNFTLEGYGQTFSVGLIDLDSIKESHSVGDISYSGVATIEQSWLKTDFQGANELADQCEFVFFEDDSFQVQAESDTASYVGQYDEEAAGVVSITSAGDFESWYSIEYLTDLVESAPADALVSMRIPVNRPLALTYEAADGTVSVHFNLAPRIPDESRGDTQEAGNGGSGESPDDQPNQGTPSASASANGSTDAALNDD
jgi:proliferating cell nuclear antigen